MATELVTETWCDKHLVDASTKVRASTSAVVTLDGTSYTLDLCEDCAHELMVFSEWLESYGQPSGSAPSGPPRAATLEAAGRLQCKVCQRSYGNIASLRAHYRQSHEMAASQYAKYMPPNPTGRKASAPMVCPTCGFEAAGGTGLAAHRRAAHPTG